MWLICQTAYKKGITKLLIRGVAGAEWVFCPMVKSIKNDKVTVEGCQKCLRFIRIEQTLVPQTRTGKRGLMPKHTNSLHFMKTLNRRKIKPLGVGLLAQPLGVIKEKQPIVDVFEEKNHLLILAQLPGMDEKDVSIEAADENTIMIKAENAAKKYLETVKLPASIARGVVKFTYRNNILQARLKKTSFLKH